VKDILSAAGRAGLEAYAAGNVLVGFDFDGTLAPIVREPRQAQLPDATRALLVEVARRYPCCVISGRARRDVLPSLKNVPLLGVIGNHGLETGAPLERAARSAVLRWRRELRALCVGGVRLEDKSWSLALHYRGARDRSARRRILAAAARLAGVRVVPGKQVVNLVPSGAADKGAALMQVCARVGCAAAIYLGDDVTDEDVFALQKPGQLLAIRVGRSGRSKARWFVRRQADVDRLLSLLIALRPARGATKVGRAAP